MKKIYISCGDKGGVGKSFVAIALVDYLTQNHEKQITLIETDSTNQDVALPYRDDDRVEIKAISLDNKDGWIEAVNCCADTEDDVVINMAARSNQAVANSSPVLTESLEELNREIISLFVINRQRDSIRLLKEYAKNLKGKVHVVRNNYFGAPTQFERFNNSDVSKQIAENGSILDFDAVADRVADDIYSQRLSIAKAMEKMPIGNRAELKRWRIAVWKMFDTALL